MSALMRKKSKTLLNEDNLNHLFTDGKTTIEQLGNILIKSDVSNQVLFTKYSQVNGNNVIKLLVRAQRLYEAYREVTKIFKTIIELEEVMKPKSAVWRILQDQSESELSSERNKMVEKTLHLLSKVLAQVSVFQADQKLFKGDFRFRKTCYRQVMRDWGLVIGGFLLQKGLPNPLLTL